MKKLLLTIGLAAITIADTQAQGTISWRNSVATPILVSFFGSAPRIATEADGLNFGLFVGPAGSSADALVQASGTANIGTVDGLLVNASSVLPLPGTEGGQVVSIQVRAWDSMRLLSINGPPVRQVVLGPPPGPGAVIWTTDPASRTFYIVPEPSTLALGALGALVLSFFRRKSAHK